MKSKKTAKRKITGVVSNLTAQQIRVDPPKGKTWEIKRTPNTKVKVISGTPLRRGSIVTVEFNTGDGKGVGGPGPGKRTETGTVITLTAQQIRLDHTTPDSGPWVITRTNSTRLLSGTLAVNSTARVESNDSDWQLVLA